MACGPGGVGKTTTAAAAAVMAAVRHGSKVLVLTIDPAKRLANALGLDGIGNAEHRVPDESFRVAGLKPRGQLWAAMLDTKESWDALDPAPRARPADQGRDPGQSAVPEHLRPVRAEPRLHRHGASLRDPLGERLRPHRGGHPADPERPRLPRRPPAHGRLLLVTAPPLADRPLPLATGERGHQTLLHDRRPDPRYRVPGGHLGVLHPVPIDVRRIRRALRGRGSAVVRPPHHLHRGVHPRGRAVPRGRVLRRAADVRAVSTSGPSS